jgi:predicted CXXCH cytochrome family protein
MKFNNPPRRYSLLAAVVVAVTWVALPATAQITGSVHDLNAYLPALSIPDGRVCVACHTPHNANTTVAPLWNHAASAGGHTPYDSGSIDALDLGAPAGISLMCLSCHDGSAALDSFGGGTRTDQTPGTLSLAGTALLDVNLSNDHPVSFTYDTALAGVDVGLHDPSATASGIGGNIDTDMLFGLGNDQMECSSCHDVHNGPTVVESPLLIKSNASSGLCFTCHNK